MDKKTIIIGRRRSERLCLLKSEKLNCNDDDESNGPLDNRRVDPSQILPLEVFAHLLEKCFGTLSLKELQKMRFISKEWRIRLERMWRKRVVVYLDYVLTRTIDDAYENVQLFGLAGEADDNILPPTGVSEFLMRIKNPSFDYKNTPLRNFNIKSVNFPSNCIKHFFEYCGPYIKQLNLENIEIMGFSQFFQFLFANLNNMEQLQLVKPSFCSFENSPDASPEPVNLPVARNLTSLTMDFYIALQTSNIHLSNMHEQFQDLPFHMTQKEFLSSFPNLQNLTTLAQVNNPIFKIEIFLQSILELSLTGNHFQRLKHLQICQNSIWDSNGGDLNVWTKVKRLCNSQFPSLESFHFHFYAQLEPDKEKLPLVSERIVNAFGRQLKSLTLLLEPLPMSEFFPFRTRLEKLEHLTVSCDLSDFILNAKYLPNLKSFSARTRYCSRATCKREMYHRVYWLNSENRIYGKVENHRNSNGNIKDVERFWTQYQQEILDDPKDRDFIFFEDDDNTLQECGTSSNKDKIILKRGRPNVHNYYSGSEDEEDEYENKWQATSGFLSVGYRRLRRTLVFENVTELAIEMTLSCRIFKKLPKWMPNVISLEAHITACTLPIICEKWRKMQKLTLLKPQSVYRRPLGNINNIDWTFCENYAPIDDCAIIGVKHFSNPHFICSLHHLVEGEKRCAEINWEYFTTPLIPSSIPNLTFLKDLTHFKMEIGRITRVDKDSMTLSDESVFRAFLKLSKLEYLEILADL